MPDDSCPYCGAPRSAEGRERIYWACGTNSAGQSPECARYVRTLISQLKRMLRYAEEMKGWYWPYKFERHLAQIGRFQAACLRKIERLRGGA